MHHPFLAAVVGLTLLGTFAGGCSALDDALGRNARCDFRPKTPQCTDWRGFKGPSTVMNGLCSTIGQTTGGGTFAEDATCDRADMLGGCESTQGDGSKQTNWFYKGEKYPDVAAAQNECDSARWVSPK